MSTPVLVNSSEVPKEARIDFRPSYPFCIPIIQKDSGGYFVVDDTGNKILLTVVPDELLIGSIPQTPPGDNTKAPNVEKKPD